MECDRNRVATPEIDDVAVLEVTFVDLLIVDERSVGRIPVNEQHAAVDRHHLGMEPRHLRILQYDLTNRGLAPDPDAGAAEAELLAGAVAVEDREAAEHRRGRRGGRRPARRPDRLLPGRRQAAPSEPTAGR